MGRPGVWVLRLPDHRAGRRSVRDVRLCGQRARRLHGGDSRRDADRIVCANTLGAALRQAERGAHAERTFRFRHTGNLQAKFAEARQVSA